MGRTKLYCDPEHIMSFRDQICFASISRRHECMCNVETQRLLYSTSDAWLLQHEAGRDDFMTLDYVFRYLTVRCGMPS
jgi:hypothetical protein